VIVRWSLAVEEAGLDEEFHFRWEIDGKSGAGNHALSAGNTPATTFKWPKLGSK
jgi:hypothetical protein